MTIITEVRSPRSCHHQTTRLLTTQQPRTGGVGVLHHPIPIEDDGDETASVADLVPEAE